MPTTTGRATDFITFTRTSNATVTDSNGFIKWAGHNLLTNSESFDASAWTKSSAPITANAASAPNGTTTADRANATATGDVYQSIALTAGVKYKLAIWAKSFGGTNQTFRLFADNNMLSSDFTATSSWQLFEFEFTAATGGASRACGVTNGVSNAAYDVLLWGAHLYRSDLGGMVLNPARGDAYYPTTPRNLLGFTEDFSNAAWDKSSFGTSATSNTLIAPNGLQTADLITAINSTNNHLVYQSSGINLAASGVVTGSIYVKADTATFVRLGVVDNLSGADWAGFIVNLSTGAVTNTYTGANASNVTTHTPVSVGNGWYRVGITATLTASTNDLTFRVGPFNAASASPGNYFSVSWAAAGTESIYLWGAQLSDSASLDAYSPVYGAAVTSAAYYAPRLDYDPVTLAAKGLLVEEQRANLMLRSNEFNISWVAAGTTVTANTTAVTAPDGTTTADKLVETATTGSHSITQQITSVIGRVYTASVYAKAAERTITAVRIDNLANSFTWFNLATGVIGTKQSGVTATITDAGGGWYRCSVTGTATATNHGLEVYIADADNSSSYAGDITKGVYLYGAQLEDNAPFATSYIPTGASTATRTADVASVSTQAFPYSATEGTLVAAFSYLGGSAANSSNQAIVTLRENSTNNIFIYNGGGTVAGWCVVNSVDQAYLTRSSVSAGVVTKAAFAFKTNDFAMVQDGGAASTDTSGTLPTPNIMGIGSNGASSLYANGHIRQITYLPRRLTNAELVARST